MAKLAPFFLLTTIVLGVYCISATPVLAKVLFGISSLMLVLSLAARPAAAADAARSAEDSGQWG